MRNPSHLGLTPFAVVFLAIGCGASTDSTGPTTPANAQQPPGPLASDAGASAAPDAAFVPAGGAPCTHAAPVCQGETVVACSGGQAKVITTCVAPETCIDGACKRPEANVSCSLDVDCVSAGFAGHVCHEGACIPEDAVPPEGVEGTEPVEGPEGDPGSPTDGGPPQDTGTATPPDTGTGPADAGADTGIGDDEGAMGDGDSGACEPTGPEVCDNEDNDCNGETDEGLTQPCDNGCGPGTATCVKGEFTNCDAPIDCKCTPKDKIIANCGTCGKRELTCQDDGKWNDPPCDDPVNACGGCNDLGVAVGGTCGLCGVWVCLGTTNTKCDDPGMHKCMNYLPCVAEDICGNCPEIPAEICDMTDNDCDPSTPEQGQQVNCDPGLACRFGVCQDPDGGVPDGGGGNPADGGVDGGVDPGPFTGALKWARRFGGTNPDSSEGVARDTEGNLIITGFFRSAANYGGSDLVSTGNEDIFLGKYTPDGVHMWSKHFGGLEADHGLAVTADRQGNLIVAGRFGFPGAAPADLGGGPIQSAGGADSFVAKYDPDGKHLWSRGLGGYLSNDYASSLAVDDFGNVVVAGTFNGTAIFGGDQLISAGGGDVFMARFDASGQHLWSRRFGGTGEEWARGVALDAVGNIVLVGEFGSTCDFGGGSLTPAGNADVFIAKFNPSSTHVWSKSFGGSGYDSATAVAVGGWQGLIAITGSFRDPGGTGVSFGGTPLTGTGDSEVFAAVYDSAGNHVWSKGFSTTQFDYGRAVAVDSYGNTIISGTYGDNGVDIDFGGGPLPCVGYRDMYLAKFSPAGAHLWSKRFGGTGNDVGQHLITGPDDDIFVTGNFGNTIDFGTGNLTTAGGSDVFLAVFQK